MKKFLIRGGKQLFGTVEVSGAKNAILPIIAACLLTRGKSVLTNVPKLVDLKTMAHLLRIIGARVNYDNGRMEIDSSDVCFPEAPYELVSKMRASIYVLGPLLTKFKHAKVSFPGGCAIGARPIDLHIKALEKMGTKFETKKGYLFATTDGLIGAEINFEKVSVGATCHILMAATLAKGTTVMRNCAVEPEIDSLIDFLKKMGAKIEGKGTRTLTVKGVKELFPVGMEMMPDRIEAGTFLIAGAITNSEITVANCNPGHLNELILKLKQAGFTINQTEDSMHILPTDRILPVNIVTDPYPAFPTDLQAQFIALMTLADGISYVEDRIYPDRFMHVPELNRLQADIIQEKGKAKITGVEELSGAEVMATDLRASAALVLAGLAAEGETIVSRIYHIDRGYDNIEGKLNKLGASIERIED
jgi:UDP-N-acetylglucosamine 1-carboxyvinyltransferase